MGVRTFEATSGKQVVDLIEQHPIHLAVVDSRLPSISGINVLQLIQKLRDQPERFGGSAAPAKPPQAGGLNAAPGPENGFSFQMQVSETSDAGTLHRRIEVRFDARPSEGKQKPAVILIAPPQEDKQLLQEALKFNAFTVLSEPVDVNLMLEVMARALRRFHQNQWPTT
jgi:CheY-like chemotaxis protein